MLDALTKEDDSGARGARVAPALSGRRRNNNAHNPPESTNRATNQTTDRQRRPELDNSTQMVEPAGNNTANAEVPRFLVKINESLFSRATAKQIFMIDMDLQKSKRDKIKERPLPKKNESKVKSDRDIKVPAQPKKASPVKKAPHESKRSEGNETLNNLNSNTTEIVANVQQQYKMGFGLQDEIIEPKQLQNDSFNLSNYSPKSE